MNSHKIYSMQFGSVYPLYVVKAERKGRTKVEVNQVITWLTGYSDEEIVELAGGDTTFEQFFKSAKLNPSRKYITGVVCGVRVEEINEPLMQEVRYLDKLIDELARGKKMESILRSGR